MNFTPIGHSNRDREMLQRAAAWVSADLRDNATEIQALLDGADALDAFDLARALLEMLRALHERQPLEVEQMLDAVRWHNATRTPE